MPLAPVMIPVFITSGAFVMIFFVASLAVYVRVPSRLDTGRVALTIATALAVLWISMWASIFLAPDPDTAKSSLGWAGVTTLFVGYATHLLLKTIDRMTGHTIADDKRPRPTAHEPAEV